jgi:hypothetical protein
MYKRTHTYIHVYVVCSTVHVCMCDTRVYIHVVCVYRYPSEAGPDQIDRGKSPHFLHSSKNKRTDIAWVPMKVILYCRNQAVIKP